MGVRCGWGLVAASPLWVFRDRDLPAHELPIRFMGARREKIGDVFVGNFVGSLVERSQHAPFRLQVWAFVHSGPESVRCTGRRERGD